MSTTKSLENEFKNYSENNQSQIATESKLDLLDILWRNGQVRIPLYGILFLLCIIGNCLVILTLVRDKRMRTVTNVFLLNLSISDLLLGTFCIPFTLVGSLLRQFIFGSFMCRLVPYLQAVTVAVSAWTLVAMSVERYYAICHPLRSRRWQTISHARKIIGTIWIASLSLMLPIALLSQLIPLKNAGKYKCREIWPDKLSEKGFTVLLDFILLIIPLLVMVATYSCIGSTLRKSFQSTSLMKSENLALQSLEERKGQSARPHFGRNISNANQKFDAIRRTNANKALQQKKRIIIMLIVVVMEFFICWGPLYAVNTISMFAPEVIYDQLGYKVLSLIQIVAHASSISNPITYCFLNEKFRQCFIAVVNCKKKERFPRYSMYDGTLNSKKETT